MFLAVAAEELHQVGGKTGLPVHSVSRTYRWKRPEQEVDDAFCIVRYRARHPQLRDSAGISGKFHQTLYFTALRFTPEAAKFRFRVRNRSASRAVACQAFRF